MPLELKSLTINRDNQRFIGPFNLQVSRGEVLTIMGPSGCGKSTLLSAISGHMSEIFSLQGSIILNMRLLNALPAHKRSVGMLFQDDLLFAHLSVWENLALSLPDSEQNRKKKALSVLEEVDLIDLADAHPDTISGGQRARISVLRALLSNPAALLLDEPFSKLDKPLRASFRQFVYERIQQANIPALLVTHDIDDAPTNGKIFNWPE
ncbi:ATP-binding cassette domain-containing protein [Thaumasiovibrio subtropicus]|uniref:ATP-binding cassette domain-containing protein n=1 Tax=Thaumasiovibrio subtropicus TaxID=1891207 RepID=UPI000B34CC44|nr:ATP-binding cassette domain-containing protein [Thaumasiovibrio subtropicus]